jgi:hypothetical protein
MLDILMIWTPGAVVVLGIVNQPSSLYSNHLKAGPCPGFGFDF